jgi:hypothetical protein
LAVAVFFCRRRRRDRNSPEDRESPCIDLFLRVNDRK